jgi:hypothetical protein
MRKSCHGSIVKFAFGLIVVLALVGCGQSNNLPEWTGQKSDLKEGVNVISDNPKTGLKGAIVEGKSVVYFEARRGDQNDREIDADSPGYSVDARFLDDKGRTFSIVVGGDKAQDESWANTFENEEVPLNERNEHFRLASKLTTQSLAKVAAAVSTMSPEWEQMHMLGSSISQDEVITDTSQLKKSVEAKAVTKWTHEITAYKKNASGTLGLADHSATWTKQKYSDGKLYKQVITCNHGTCANASSMNKYGSSSYKDRTTDITSLISGDVNSWNGYCGTSYGIFSGNHVCNDDTLAQLMFIKKNSGACYSFCGDSTLARRAPALP